MEICREAAQLGDSFPRQTVLQIREWCGRLHNIMAESFLCQVNSPFSSIISCFWGHGNCKPGCEDRIKLHFWWQMIDPTVKSFPRCIDLVGFPFWVADDIPDHSEDHRSRMSEPTYRPAKAMRGYLIKRVRFLLIGHRHQVDCTEAPSICALNLFSEPWERYHVKREYPSTVTGGLLDKNIVPYGYFLRDTILFFSRDLQGIKICGIIS